MYELTSDTEKKRSTSYLFVNPTKSSVHDYVLGLILVNEELDRQCELRGKLKSVRGSVA